MQGQAPTMKVDALDPQSPPVLHHMVSVKEGTSNKSQEDPMQVNNGLIETDSDLFKTMQNVQLMVWTVKIIKHKEINT